MMEPSPVFGLLGCSAPMGPWETSSKSVPHSRPRILSHQQVADGLLPPLLQHLELCMQKGDTLSAAYMCVPLGNCHRETFPMGP